MIWCLGACPVATGSQEGRFVNRFGGHADCLAGSQPTVMVARIRDNIASQRCNSEDSMYSSGLCACLIEPGPQTTLGAPAAEKYPASVPKSTLPIRPCGSRNAPSQPTMAASGGVSSAG